MLRFDLEQALISGDLSVADLPAAWNDAMQDALGITLPNDALGVLQDAHWTAGHFGHFPTCTLGSLMNVQLVEAANAAHPQLPHEIRHGRSGTLRGWLRENVFQHGARYLPDALLKRATGSELDAGPYLAYLRGKYGERFGRSPVQARGRHEDGLTLLTRRIRRHPSFVRCDRSDPRESA